MQIAEIKNWLPHREPFLLIDEIDEVVPDQKISGSLRIRAEAPWFSGHFPGNPVMPGVLMVEALAQLSCVLAFKSLGGYKGQSVFFAGINEVRFRRVVKPHEILRMESSILKRRRNIWVFTVRASVADQTAVEGEIMAGFEI